MENLSISNMMKSPLPVAILVMALSFWFGGAFVRGSIMVALGMFNAVWSMMSYFLNDKIQRFIVMKARWVLDILISVGAMTFGGSGATALIAGVYAGIISLIFFGLLAKQYEREENMAKLA